jgi:hypothetical protein
MNINELQAKYLDGEFVLRQEFLNSDYMREETISRCEKYAGWTIPTVFPEDTLMEYDEMQLDYQSVGAQAVTNLSNKIMMALFQPSRPFFRMNLSQEQKQEVLSGGAEEAQIDAALAEAERAALHNLNATNARIIMHDVMQQLIITGNSLLHAPKGGDMTAYSVRDYCIKRDLRGRVIKIIIKETKSVSGLSDELQEICIKEGYMAEDDVSIYTGAMRTGEDKFVVHQELEDLAYIHRKIGVYDKDSLPWIPLTWNLARGKDYGTGLVELYSGDFHKLSTLAQAINDYSLVITDVKNLVNPAGMTDVREITEAPSGAYVHGREEDIFVHQPQVGGATDFLENQFDKTARRIGAAFLLNSAVTRDAERVTAQEIRMQAQELESSLGGVYSRLATELQLPLAKRLLKDLDPIFKDIEPVIVTGLESLSRNSELDNFRAFMQDMVALADVPEEVKLWMNFENVIATLGTGHGVDYKKFLNDAKTVAANKEAMMKANAQAEGMKAGAVGQAEAQTAPEQQGR